MDPFTSRLICMLKCLFASSPLLDYPHTLITVDFSTVGSLSSQKL